MKTRFKSLGLKVNCHSEEDYSRDSCAHRAAGRIIKEEFGCRYGH